MAEQITIAGHVFNVPVRYEEGHELTANEASALNQTYHENLRNNFAKRVEDKKDGAERIENEDVLASLQADLDKYAEDYEFGVRTGGGAVRDPVVSKAMQIAKDKVLEAMKKKGIKQKDVEPKAITERAKKAIAEHPEIMELARAQVAELQSIAALELE